MVHPQDLIQVEHLAVQVEEQVKVKVLLVALVINLPHRLHKVRLVVMEIQVQDLVVAAVELLVLVVTLPIQVVMEALEVLVRQQVFQVLL
tara:strand:+ start:42 stop:311 length:270 start_codon:yes stop_codon:yes gene_type:complete